MMSEGQNKDFATKSFENSLTKTSQLPTIYRLTCPAQLNP